MYNTSATGTEINGITFDKAEYQISVGEKCKASVQGLLQDGTKTALASETAELTAAQTDGKSVTDAVYGKAESLIYTIADPKIATVDQNGEISGITEGETTIKADYGSFTATAKITICKKTEIALDSKEYVLSIGGTHAIKVTGIKPDNTTYEITKDITFQSFNPEIAAVSKDGVITGINEGQTVITVKYKDAFRQLLYSGYRYDHKQQWN